MTNQHAKPAWMFEQSGVIPYRFEDGQLEIMLITSQRRKRWIIPKGIVEADMTPQESALTEAWEEAGITGRVFDEKIGCYEYDKWGGTCHVKVFLFEVKSVFSTWPEDITRDRAWLNVDEASERVDEADLKVLIKSMPILIENLATE